MARAEGPFSRTLRKVRVHTSWRELAMIDRVLGTSAGSSATLVGVDGRSRAELAVRFERAAARATAPRIERVLRAPASTIAVKGASVIGARTGWVWPRRAKTFWGATMRVMTPEAVSNQLLRYGLIEPGLTAYLLLLLQPNITFIDVGAHFGYFTLLAAHLVGPRGEVHAFEPTPHTFRILSANAGAHRNVFLNRSAVWCRSESIELTDLGPRLSAFNTLFTPRLDGCEVDRHRGTPLRVQAVSLDDYCRKVELHPTFVKIDAESAEHEILEGMGGVLAKDRPAVSVEVGDFGIAGVPGSAELLRSVMERGYRPFEFSRGSIRPHELKDHYGYDNILLLPEEHQLQQEWFLHGTERHS